MIHSEADEETMKEGIISGTQIEGLSPNGGQELFIVAKKKDQGTSSSKVETSASSVATNLKWTQLRCVSFRDV